MQKNVEEHCAKPDKDYGPSITAQYYKHMWNMLGMATDINSVIGEAAEDVIADPDCFKNWLAYNYPHLVKPVTPHGVSWKSKVVSQVWSTWQTYPHHVKKDPPLVNIILQTLADAELLLKSMRKYADSQEREKIDAFCSHLHYIATTTEVVPMLPSTIAPGDVLPKADTTLLRTAQESISYDDPGVSPDDSVLSQAVEAAERAPFASADTPLVRTTQDVRPLPVGEQARIKPDTINRSPVYMGRHGKQGVRWVPEAPNHKGLYAVEPKTPNDQRNCTVNINDAPQFESRALCKEWCDKRPPLMFVPREHMFIEDIA